MDCADPAVVSLQTGGPFFEGCSGKKVLTWQIETWEEVLVGVFSKEPTVCAPARSLVAAAKTAGKRVSTGKLFPDGVEIVSIRK